MAFQGITLLNKFLNLDFKYNVLHINDIDYAKNLYIVECITTGIDLKIFIINYSKTYIIFSNQNLGSNFWTMSILINYILFLY